MNLIERYGYDRAKRELTAMDNRDIWMISGDIEYREQVRAELLEHRRENNIFEVGDEIVSAFDNIEMFGNSTVEIARFRDDINCIDLIKGTYVRLTNGCDCNLDQFRHATDKEIKQGYRDE